jgi:hypothetical protein
MTATSTSTFASTSTGASTEKSATPSASLYTVRAVHCDHRAGDEEVYQQLKRATAPLTRSWQRLRRAKTIAIKFNQDWPRDKVPMFEGQRQQLVSDTVARAVLRLLRENTTARILCVDGGVHHMFGAVARVEDATNILHLLHEFDVEYVDCHQAPVAWYPVPGGGLMFDYYPVATRLKEADAVVSVQKMKNHAFMGVTLCLKNLFGLMPMPPYGRPRHYYHHIVRMPYMLADLSRIYNPALNILDALVGQAEQEWGDGVGTGRIVDGLIAGDQVVATDACGAHLMGHDPTADWPALPFRRDRNALLVAAQSGFGTVDLKQIDFESELKPQAEGVFFSRKTDPSETVTAWRRTMCEQALLYASNRSAFAAYAGEYILLQRGEVRWHKKNGDLRESRRVLAGEWPGYSMWLKYVDPQEAEGEHYFVYENTLRQMDASGVTAA